MPQIPGTNSPRKSGSLHHASCVLPPYARSRSLGPGPLGDQVDRPKAETMEHLEITEIILTAKPALDTMIDDHGHVVNHSHRIGAGPRLAQRGLEGAEGMLRGGGDGGRG